MHAMGLLESNSYAPITNEQFSIVEYPISPCCRAVYPSTRHHCPSYGTNFLAWRDKEGREYTGHNCIWSRANCVGCSTAPQQRMWALTVSIRVKEASHVAELFVSRIRQSKRLQERCSESCRNRAAHLSF